MTPKNNEAPQAYRLGGFFIDGLVRLYPTCSFSPHTKPPHDV